MAGDARVPTRPAPRIAGMNERRAASAPELKAQIEAERAGRPFLVFRDGEDEQRIVTVAEGAAELWVGRGESADVRLGWDEEVSALHAQIAVVRDECTLVDDGLSRNGSYVNEERVHGRRHLRDGDAIRFGRTTVVYRRPGDSAPEATAIADRGAGRGDGLAGSAQGPGRPLPSL